MSRSKVYLIIHTVICVLTAVLLCMSVIVLYREGTAERESTDALAWIFTPEKIADQFARIALPFFGAIGFMIAGLVLGINDPAGNASENHAECTRNILVARIGDVPDDIRKERRLQKRLLQGGWAGFAICMIPVLLYMINPAHFPPDDLEHMFYALLLGILPWIALGTGCLVFVFCLRERSVNREVSLLQTCLVHKTPGRTLPEETPGEQNLETRGRNRLFMWVRIIIVAAAAAMIIAGALNGSLKDVLVKAINLCTECIGLG